MLQHKNYIRVILKKLVLVSMIVLISSLMMACKKEVEIKKAPIVELEEEEPYEKIDDVSDDEFDNLISKVRDQIMVFDIVEVHDEIYIDLKTNVDIDNSDEIIEAQIEALVEPFMDEWTSNRIRKYLTKELGEISEDDIEKFKDKIDNRQLIEFIVIYEKNFLKGNK